MQKILQMTETQTINEETGEIKTLETTRTKMVPKEPSYIKMYLDDLGKLFDLPKGPRELLYVLVQRMDYDGFISITASAKDRLCEKLSIQKQTFANYLNTLSKSSILRNVGRGEYEVNPHLFAKGEWKDIAKRRQAFSLTITYSPEGRRTLRTESSSQGELDLGIQPPIAAE